MYILSNFIETIKKGYQFKGRARRREYWYFILAEFVISVVLLIPVYVLGHSAMILTSLFSLFIFLPWLDVSVRRLHDTNRSGKWMLISLIPFAGFILLYFMCQDSSAGDNRFGLNPKVKPLDLQQES